MNANKRKNTHFIVQILPRMPFRRQILSSSFLRMPLFSIWMLYLFCLFLIYLFFNTDHFFFEDSSFVKKKIMSFFPQISLIISSSNHVGSNVFFFSKSKNKLPCGSFEVFQSHQISYWKMKINKWKNSIWLCVWAIGVIKRKHICNAEKIKWSSCAN